MKKFSKIALVVLVVLCVAFSVFALTACGEQGEKGETGAQGPQGEQGADGSTWLSGETAPANTAGKDGDYYLDTTTSNVYKKADGAWSIILNIKGEEGEDLTACEHTYGDAVTMIKPTGTEDGYGYKTCSACGAQQIVTIDKIAGIDVRNPLMVELDANGKAVIENIANTMYIAFPVAQDGRLQVGVSSVADPTDPYSEASDLVYWDSATFNNFFTKNVHAPDGVLGNPERIYTGPSAYYDGDIAVVSLSVDDYYDQFEISTNYIAADAKFDHVITIKGVNYAGITEVQVGAEHYGMFWTEAEGELGTDGTVTLNFRPGEFDINLVGLDETIYTMTSDSDKLETTLPLDGSNDQGSNYTFTFLSEHEYTVNVTKDENPVEGATVHIFKANGFENVGTEEVPVYEVGEYNDRPANAVETLTTAANGTVIVTILDGEYTIGGEEKIGFYYLARLSTESLDFGEYATDVVLDVEANTINIEIKTATQTALSATAENLTFYAYGRNTSVAYATVTPATEGDYAITLGNVVNNATYTIYVDGARIDSITAKESGVNNVIIEGLTAAAHEIKITASSEAATLNAKTPNASIATYVAPAFEGTLLSLGEVAIDDYSTYTIKATVPGTYTFTFDSIDTCVDFYKSKAGCDADWTSYFWEADLDSLTYSVNLDANAYYTFYVTISSGETQYFTITGPETPAATALAVGDNSSLSIDGYYTFTATTAGTYTFTQSSKQIEVAKDEADYDASVYIWDPYNEGETYEVELAAGETFTAYIHFYAAVTLNIAAPTAE